MIPSVNIQNNKQSKLVLGLSILTLCFVLIFKRVSMYKNAFIGAVFEFLWLFIIAAVFILPIFAMWALYKKTLQLNLFTSLHY